MEFEVSYPRKTDTQVLNRLNVLKILEFGARLCFAQVSNTDKVPFLEL